MKSAPAKIPSWVLAQALGVAAIVGTPVLFVGFNQIRRACGDRLFGSREHFCSAHELSRWLVSLPGWSYPVVAIVAIGLVAFVHGFLRRLAS